MEIITRTGGDEDDVEWEDVEEATTGAKDQEEEGEGGGREGGADDHWRARAAVRQRFWSTSHGFAMGRKLGDWERHAGTYVCVFVGALMCGCRKPAMGLRLGGSWGTGSGMQVHVCVCVFV